MVCSTLTFNCSILVVLLVCAVNVNSGTGLGTIVLVLCGGTGLGTSTVWWYWSWYFSTSTVWWHWSWYQYCVVILLLVEPSTKLVPVLCGGDSHTYVQPSGGWWQLSSLEICALITSFDDWRGFTIFHGDCNKLLLPNKYFTTLLPHKTQSKIIPYSNNDNIWIWGHPYIT